MEIRLETQDREQQIEELLKETQEKQKETAAEEQAGEEPEGKKTILSTQLGDITKAEGFEAVVNPSNPTLSANGKGVNGSIHGAAGPELLAACQKIGGCEVGEAVLTEGYLLPYKKVIHAVGPLYRDGEGDDDLLKTTYRNCLEVAKDNGIRTVAFASISTGSPRRSPRTRSSFPWMVFSVFPCLCHPA